MILVHHRRNTLAELAQSNVEWGVEIDLRNHGQEILVTHDPFVTEAVTLERWLESYKHKFIIANVKEEGLEYRILDLFQDRGVENYFILDESFPFIRKYALSGVSNFAVRVSEYESAQTALNLSTLLAEAGKRVDWIWADTFSGAPLPRAENEALRAAGYKICVVSPELHHVADPESWQSRIEVFVSEARDRWGETARPHMVCTKMPKVWAHLWPN